MMHLPRLLLGCLLIGTLVLLAGPTAVVSAEGEFVAAAADLEAIGLTAEEQHVLALLNAARTEAGVPALAAEHTLVSLAGSRSDDMATRQYFAHTTPEGSTVLQMLTERGVAYQYAGETLQRNNYPDGETVAVAARALLASPPHRALLLDGRFSHVGVGHAVDGTMHYYTIIVVQYW